MKSRFANILLALTLTAAPTVLRAQQTMSFVPDVRTVQVLLGGEPGQMPVIALGSDDVLEISFDDLTHEYERFEYRLVHCDRDWQPSTQILPTDAADLTQESIPVEEYEYSFNTTQLYTHYRFQVPSPDLRPRISGNYRIDISRDGDYDEGLVAQACFMVMEPLARVRLSVTDNTEVDWKQSHQQVRMEVDYGAIQPRPNNPREDITAVVLQNLRWDNARCYPKPDYLSSSTLEWEHVRDLIFPAGNEYRRFENTTARHAAMGMESLRWYDPYYHATLRLGEPRRNYVYERDQNGKCVVRTTDSDISDTEADYMLVHFELQSEPLPEGQHVYVQGQWTNDFLCPENEMHYLPQRGIYEAVMLLKQGYYNYQFLVTDSSGKPGLTAPLEGDFYQTENEYHALIYYRNAFERHDRLIGYGKAGSF